MPVKLFPIWIRYTSLSLADHTDNGWFGDLLPATASAMVAQISDIDYRLWYAIRIAVATVIAGGFRVPEMKDRDIYADV